MVIAPHPDDESLGTGGVLLWAASTQTPVRVVFLTSGENNPWSQRATELRWRITPDDQHRWGERREFEAIEALGRLGVAPEAVHFLGLPDQRLTDTLVGDGGEALGRLAREIEAWRPTVIFVPSLADRHPDHSATAILTHMALARASGRARRPRILSFVIHAPGYHRNGSRTCGLLLSEPQRAAKRQAICCHASQLRLRGGYMLRFAEEPERFEIDPFIRSDQESARPLRVLSASAGRWSFAIRQSLRVALGRTALLLVSQGEGEAATLRFELPRRATRQALLGHDGRAVVGEVNARPCGDELHVTVDTPCLQLREHCLARLDMTRERRLGFFDSWSWLSFGQPARARLRSLPLRPARIPIPALQPQEQLAEIVKR